MATDTLRNVKTMLDIDDLLQDAPLMIIIKNTESHLKIWLKQHAGLTEIPDELYFIVEEMAISRFNRRGAEGAKSESVEGRSITYNEDDFKPYKAILETYTPKNERAGKVTFI